MHCPQVIKTFNFFVQKECITCISDYILSAGITGIVCLLLSIRLAHASLEHKLKPRRSKAVTSGEKEHALAPYASQEELTTSEKSDNPREASAFSDIERNIGEHLDVIPTGSIKVPSVRKRVSIALVSTYTVHCRYVKRTFNV